MPVFSTFHMLCAVGWKHAFSFPCTTSACGPRILGSVCMHASSMQSHQYTPKRYPHTHTHRRIHTHTHLLMHTHTYTYMYAQIHTHTHTRTHTHIHTHAHSSKRTKSGHMLFWQFQLSGWCIRGKTHNDVLHWRDTWRWTHNRHCGISNTNKTHVHIPIDYDKQLWLWALIGVISVHYTIYLLLTHHCEKNISQAHFLIIH